MRGQFRPQAQTRGASQLEAAFEKPGGEMFRRLLVPISGDAPSSVAVGFAIDIAKARSGEIVFCYALDVAQLGMGPQADSSWVEMLRPEAEKVGKDALARAAQADCPATLQILDGVAAEVVVRLAPAFDLVVMGTRAIHGVAQIFERSVTDSVVRTCTRPVLVVRERDIAPATLSPTNAFFQRIIVPVDGSPTSRAAVDVAVTLASEHAEELLFVYVLDRSRATAFSGRYAFDPGGAFEVMRKFGANLLATTESAARAAGATRVTTKLLDGDPFDAILRAITDERPDAVIIGTHGRQGFERMQFGSITEDLIRKSPIPIIALHTPEAPANGQAATGA